MKSSSRLVVGSAILALMLLLGLCLTDCLAQSFSAPAPPPVVPVLPTDVTNLRLIDGLPLGPVSMPKLDPTSAIKRVSEDSFPTAEQAKDAEGGIIIEPQKGTDMERTSTACVQLTSGTIFVSVRKPANLAIITTPHGTISVANDGEVIISFVDGLLKVMNLSAFGERVKVKINQAAVSASINGQSYGEAKTEGIAMALKIGHELVASDRGLNRMDLRPTDSIARRRSALFENDHMAVSEFSLESALNKSELLRSLIQDNHDPKERRVLRDLAKMSAVLNYVNGEGGFVAGGKQK